MSKEYPFQKSRKIEKEPQIVKVGMDKYEVIKPGMIGETTGLGPCFGIIIYDTVSKYAIVGHFVDPIGNFDLVIAEAKKRFKNVEQVKVYVGGGAPDTDDAPHFKQDREKRDFVKSKLRETGFQIAKIDYQTSMESTILKIDTRNGSVNYDTIADWEN
jgi:chemotaxis receptor (MCP) glutamine deamidase CheD